MLHQTTLNGFLTRVLAAASLAIALGAGSDGRAAEMPVSGRELPLQPSLSASAYLWATGLDGKLRTLSPLPTVNVSIGFDQVMQNFDGGLMGAAEAKFGRYLLFLDVIASKISPDKIVYPAGYPAGIKVESGALIGLTAAGYRLVEDPAYSVDAFAGMRGFTMKNTLRVQLMPATLKLGESEQWVDAVVGLRLKLNLAPTFYATTIGFLGKGGSRYEWDVFGGAGYDFSDRISAFAGYRAMKVDYRNGSFVYNALQQGPVLGLAARF